MTPRTCLLIALGLAGLSACSSSPGGRVATGTSCDDAPDPHCDHPLDRVLVPMLRDKGLPVREAPAAEVCRRLGIDLLDRIPTPEEQAACEQRAPLERVDAFMATEDYLRHERRVWAARIGYDDFFAWPGHLIELDELAAALARGELTYPDFVGLIAVHPGFYALHYEDDWARSVVRIGFHRDAREDEIDALRPLTRPWEFVPFCDGASYWTRTTVYGKDAEEPDGEYCEAYLVVFHGCICAQDGCRTNAFGADIDFEIVGCANENDEDDHANLFRLTPATPDGVSPLCPDGTEKIECTDRDLNDETGITYGPFEPIGMIDDSVRGRLAALGQAMATKNDFWEAAADRELERFLGWWKSGFKQPEWDVPAVRAEVAKELRHAGSMRQVHRLILSSLLYTAPSAPPTSPDAAAAEPPPAWSMGPMKLLAGEAWLDSVGVLVGETVGRCDFRFLTAEAETYGFVNVDPNLVDVVPSTLGEAFLGEELAPLGDGLRAAEAYAGFAARVGGCSNSTKRPAASSVGIVAAQRDIGQRLCAAGRDAVPGGLDPADTSDSSLDGVTDHVVRRALGRAPDADEQAAFRGEMRACLDAGIAAGCPDAAAAARWLCQRIVDSAEFAIY